jgi:hypothetical protein
MQFMHKQTFFIHRNKNKQLIRTIMKSIEWDANDESKDLSKADSLTQQQLQAMQAVARMKEAADRCGAGFVGGFITPTGERFMMSNVEEGDAQHDAIIEKLNAIQQERYEALQQQTNIERLRRMLEEFEG